MKIVDVLQEREAPGKPFPGEIYVDMDGVLADFFNAWASLMKVDKWWNISKEHDIDDALQKIRDTDDFWLNIPLTPNAKNLLNLIKQFKGSYNICSSPLPGDPKSEPHKREWIEKHLAFFPPKNIYITHDKAQYAVQSNGTPNILIDDYGVNIRKWEAAGGIGFKHKDHKFERTVKRFMQGESIDEVIRKLPSGEYRLYSKDGKKNLGTYPSRAGAEKRERQVQYFKHNEAIGHKDVGGTTGQPEIHSEAWSEKYKRSINCNNPKGFSQKAHCAGRKK